MAKGYDLGPKTTGLGQSRQPSEERDRWLPFLVCGLISLGVALVLLTANMAQQWERKVSDCWMRWFPCGKVSEQIYIAAIDDNSIALIGRWPWPRKIHAAFLRSLSRYPPAVIGIDILFTEPEDKNEGGDLAISHYARRLGNVVFAGYIGKEDEKIVLPVSPVREGGETGFINVTPDIDGITRKIPLILNSAGSNYPSFVLQVLCNYLNTDFDRIEIHPGQEIIVPGFGKIPIDKDGAMWIKYAGDQHLFQPIAYQQIIAWGRGNKQIEQFAGKIVLAGITATGIGDTGNIPLVTNVPSITVHANSLNAILNRDFIWKAPLWLNILAVLIVLLLIQVVNYIYRPVKATACSLFIIILYLLINTILFINNIWVDILAPVGGILTAFVTVAVYKYGWEEKQRRWMKKIFAHFVSAEVINAILKNPEKLRLGGETKTITVLFLDLRNFTNFCEKRSPRDVVNLLNDSFDWMTEIIIKHEGMLDKYIGDCIMALFGAPAAMAPEDQAYRAVKAAVEIVVQWQKEEKHKGKGLDVGVGISTGPALTGNMGSRNIFNYTAVGDTVNVAARITGLTSKYSTNILINDYTYNLVKDKFEAVPLGSTQVKGRKEPVFIYGISLQNKKTAAAITVE